jgi:hypothetical protein
MLRLMILAATLGLLVGSAPALAQKFTGSCSNYCMSKVCASSTNKNYCMSTCERKCRLTNPNAKP